MTRYVALWSTPGCLPDSTEPAPVFDTAEDAWTYLADEARRDEGTAYVPDNEDDPDGPASLAPFVLELEEHARREILKTGTVYGAGLAWTVDYAEED